MRLLNCVSNILDELIDAHVIDLVDGSGQWNYNLLNSLMPPPIVRKFLSILHPSLSHLMASYVSW